MEKLYAAAVFVTGCAVSLLLLARLLPPQADAKQDHCGQLQVIAATTLDVQKSIRLNESPVSPEQQQALENFIQQKRRGEGA